MNEFLNIVRERRSANKFIENITIPKDKISQLLNIPENEIPVLMITMGKMDKGSSKVRGYRKPAAEFVKFY